MRKLTEVALRRNPDEQELDRSKSTSSSPAIMLAGAREIHRRTRWSTSLCNAVAAAWAFGSVEV